IYNADDEFVEGYEYDELGRGVVSLSPAKFLRVEYSLEAPPYRVMVTNESSGEYHELEIENGRIKELSVNDCCAGSAVRYERDSGGFITAKIEPPAEPGAAEVRTAYRLAEGQYTIL